MVCIIDDREDVWSHASNLIHVKPYHFFQHTGDINAPPGLDKQENDEKEGVDLNKVKAKSKNENGKALNTGDTQMKVDEEKTISENNINRETSEETKKEKEKNEKCEEKDVPEGIQENGKLSENNEDIQKNSSVPEINNKTAKIDKLEQNSEHPSSDNNINENDEEYLDIEDPDDYLLYLEDILRKIHIAFYKEYDQMESGQVPDLKQVIPNVRSQVLKGCNLVFSGLVPTHIKLVNSKAYQVARSLGANVTQDLQEDTTHLVAVRPGTAKVNAGRRRKNIKIVTPDWLWTCAERWEHVNETIYPLNRRGSKNRHPPPHCSSPEHVPNYPVHDSPAIRKRTPSGRFMDTINPLMSFSSDDIADMDKEVEDMLDDESDSDDDANKKGTHALKSAPARKEEEEENSSSSGESLTSEYPRGFKRARSSQKQDAAIDTEGIESSLDEFPSTKFRRGEKLDSDLDLGDSNSDGSVDPPDEIEDGEWNMMGAALEREFLSNS